MNRISILIILVQIFLSSFFQPAYAQYGDEEEYLLLLDEIAILRANDLLPQEQHALLDSAYQYADKKMFDIAAIFLEELVQSQPVFEKENSYFTPTIQKKYELFIRTGVDYNRQEFEVGYFQTDSVFIEQVQKPYIAVNYHQYLLNNALNSTFFSLDFRYDKENIMALARLETGFTTKYFESRINIGFVYDNNTPFPDLSYKEGNTRQYFRWQLASGMIWMLDNTLRYKKYKAPSVSVPDFIRDRLSSSITFWDMGANSYSVRYNLDFNESLQIVNNDYRMHTFDFAFGNINPALFNYTFYLGYRTNRFQYIVSDSVIKNNSQSIFADINIIVNIMSQVRLKALYRPKIKSYKLKTEQEPDYTYHELSTMLNFDLNPLITMETGFLYESKKHKEFSGSQAAYIKEQNYHGSGLALGLNYSSLKGYYISLNGSYIWRRYPDAIDLDLFRMYSNKNILSILLMVQMPISNHLEINAFISYDNDQDLDTDENNTRSSFFSAEFVYKF